VTLPASPRLTRRRARFYSTIVTASAASKQALPENPRRAYLLIQGSG